MRRLWIGLFIVRLAGGGRSCFRLRNCIYLSFYVCMCLLPLYLKNGATFHHENANRTSCVQYLNAYRFSKNFDSRWPKYGGHLEKPKSSSNFLNIGPILSVFFSRMLRISRGTFLVSRIFEILRDLTAKRDRARSRLRNRLEMVKLL